MFLTVLKIHFFFLLTTQYPFLQNSLFSDILPYRSGSDILKKQFRHFFSLKWFHHYYGRRKYKLHRLVVSRLSNQIHLSISGLLIVMGKPVRRKEEFGTKQLHNGLKNQPHGNWKIKTIRTIRSNRICRFYKCFIPDAKKY